MWNYKTLGDCLPGYISDLKHTKKIIEELPSGGKSIFYIDSHGEGIGRLFLRLKHNGNSQEQIAESISKVRLTVCGNPVCDYGVSTLLLYKDNWTYDGDDVLIPLEFWFCQPNKSLLESSLPYGQRMLEIGCESSLIVEYLHTEPEEYSKFVENKRLTFEPFHKELEIDWIPGSGTIKIPFKNIDKLYIRDSDDIYNVELSIDGELFKPLPKVLYKHFGTKFPTFDGPFKPNSKVHLKFDCEVPTAVKIIAVVNRNIVSDVGSFIFAEYLTMTLTN